MEEEKKNISLGLTPEQITESLKQFGSNKTEGKDLTILKVILSSLFSVFNIVMGTLVIVMFVIGQKSDGIFIGSVASINTLIELVQNIRARLMIKRLEKLTQKTAKVIRQINSENKIIEIPVDELVVGDIIKLEIGDKVPVDGEVISSDYAELDESILTGESDYVVKNPKDSINAGSFLVAGSCFYKTTKLLKDSFVQKMTQEIENKELPKTELAGEIDQLIKYLTYMTLFFIALIATDGIISSRDKAEIILNSTTIITSLVPQGLVLITTLSFSYGAMRIAKQNAIAQKISAIESMASTKVICMDKTGTLTQNILLTKDIKYYPES